jgi:hypothetical protein
MIAHNRKRIVPGLVALSLLSGVVVSLMSTPNAQADFYTGCGYGYNSGGHTGFGTGFGYGYGLTGVGGTTGVFGYGFGNQVCPPTTTTTTGGGSGGGGTTTTIAGTTTTTTGSTTTTTLPSHKLKRFFAIKVHGYAVVGRSVRLAITGEGFYGRPTITSNEVGTSIVVQHDYGNLLIVRVTVPAGSRKGEHIFTITLANGRSCKVNYLVK